MVPPPELDWRPSHQLPNSRADFEDRLLLRTREGTAMLGISPSMMAKLLADGTIPSIRIGRARRIVRADLERFVADRIADAR